MKHLKKFNEGTIITAPKHGENCDCAQCKGKFFQDDLDDISDMFQDIADEYGLEKVPPTDDDINLDNCNSWLHLKMIYN